ncbi:MAG: Grx4 family monothiol glutaredoxin [Myxococcales bacterium]|nr:Grx4 family monothiol glutaredoxin [Myxococcales bacterium]
MNVQQRIEAIVHAHPVVLFMKGTRARPMCGFSASVVGVLDEYLDTYETVDVLADEAIRQGVKEYASWPTIPQLYVNGEFVGGCDIVREMGSSGELESVLGSPRRDAPRPEVLLTDAAAAAIRKLDGGEGPVAVRLQISPAFEYAMDFDDPRPDDVALEADGITLLLDRSSARRADGLTLDYLERGGGDGGFRIDNPNEPPKVQPMTPAELKQRLDAAAPVEVFDVRGPDERARATIAGAHPLDDEGKALLEHLDRDTPIVLYCHHGVRSAAAAEHCLRMGFRTVYNLAGGIDAWSTEVDPSVPRY